ncbi:hypothetical protein ACFC4S_24385 [Priestia megaterium]|uniref:hypothetical protein n=1 Tax=Priestia megaterium TaxID=1404 RepID=UPI0035E056E0
MHMTRSEWKRKQVVLNRKNFIKKHGKGIALGTATVFVVASVGYSSALPKDKPAAAQNEIEISSNYNEIPESVKDAFVEQENTTEGQGSVRTNELAKVISKGSGVLSKIEQAKKDVIEEKSVKSNLPSSNSIAFSKQIMPEKHLLVNSEKTSFTTNTSRMTTSVKVGNTLLSNNLSSSVSTSKQAKVASKTSKKEEELLKMNSDYNANEVTNELKTMEGAKDIEASKVQDENLNKKETVAVSEDTLETAGTFTGRFGDNTIILDMDGEEGSFYTNESSMKDKLKNYNVGSYLDVRYSKDTNNYNRINDVFLIHNGATNNSREFEALYMGKHQNVVSLKEANSQPKEYEMSNYFAKENKNFIPGSQVWVVGANDNKGFKVENIVALENPKPKTMLLTSRPATAEKREVKPSVKTTEVQISKPDVIKENKSEVQPTVNPKQEEVVQNTVDVKTDITATVDQQSNNNANSAVETTEVTPVSTNEEAPVELSVTSEQTVNAVEKEEKAETTNSSEEKTANSSADQLEEEVTTDSSEEVAANNLVVQPEEEKTN